MKDTPGNTHQGDLTGWFVMKKCMNCEHPIGATVFGCYEVFIMLATQLIRAKTLR